MKTFSAIVGATLKSVSMPSFKDPSTYHPSKKPGSELTLLFDAGHLTINNPYILRCDSGESVNANHLIGCSVTHSYSDQKEFVIVFDGRIYLSVSLLEEDFVGPEAAMYRPASGNIVIID